MPSKSYIALNFFPLESQDFAFTVYRRQYIATNERRPESAHQRRLPVICDFKNYKEVPKSQYWVSYEPRDGFEVFNCTAQTDFDLTEHYLFHLLETTTKTLGASDYKLPDNKEDEIRFLRIKYFLKHHDFDRHEAVWLEPYYLWSKKEFGFLVDFTLDVPSGETLSKRDLELTLNNKNGRRNFDFYADRFSKIKSFVSRFHHRLFPLHGENEQIFVKKTLRELESSQLKKKNYIFSDKQNSYSQFMGMRDFHPLTNAPESGKVYFVYRSIDKSLSYELYRALEGKKFNTFPGMEKMFEYNLYKNTRGIEIKDFGNEEIGRLCEHIKKSANGEASVPLILIPFEKGSEDYYYLKHTLLKNGVPSQCVRLETLKSENDLKWSVSNIGLQLFAKLGGKPWMVEPANEKCLIIGIGQAHKLTEDKKIEKSFAYTVLTDSSGIYKELKILSASRNGDNYIEELKDNFRQLLLDFKDEYKKFVIHLTYKIKGKEIATINEVLNEALANAEKEFVVMKFNDKNKYFGYSLNNNSLIPYESSFVQLSNNEYLVWFEGLQYNSTVPKRIERPVHVQFLYPKDLNHETKTKYLQDAVNLSGANWRGFNAKSIPVSIHYAKLVADYVKEFQHLELSEVDWESLTPWFL
ncbi:MAG: Piwi domain-containing protein [Pyrinomonadaceae bacterium]